MTVVAFGGELGDPEFTHDLENDVRLDVDAATDELQQAGYTVFRLPDKYGGRLAHPLDDFVEAHIEGRNDPGVISDTMDAVDAIVKKYGGCVCECGPVEPGHIPFADVFEGRD